MTVRELIEKLKTMPQDVVVVYDHCSDVDELTEDDIKLIDAESQKVVKRNGAYQSTWGMPKRLLEGAEFVTVVNLP